MIVTISCVIPTHNRPEFLGEALRSAVSQSLPPLEIIVVSDTVDDRARRLCSELASEHAVPIRYVENTLEPTGASSSRNRGAEVCHGSHLAFLDDDDTWDTTYLERIVFALREEKTPLVVAGLMIFKGDLIREGPVMPSGLKATDVIALNPGATGSNILVEKSAFSRTQFDPDLRMKNDTDFLYRFLKAGNAYSVVTTRLVNQRKHNSGQLTGHSLDRANFTEMYLRKHSGDMTSSDRRHLRFVISRIRRHSSRNLRTRFYNLVLSILNYSLARFRLDHRNASSDNYFPVPAFDNRGESDYDVPGASEDGRQSPRREPI